MITESIWKVEKMLFDAEVEIDDLITKLYDAQRRKCNIYKALTNLNEKQHGRFRKERANEKHLH